jgi:hypothetical protein
LLDLGSAMVGVAFILHYSIEGEASGNSLSIRFVCGKVSTDMGFSSLSCDDGTSFRT